MEVFEVLSPLKSTYLPMQASLGRYPSQLLPNTVKTIVLPPPWTHYAASVDRKPKLLGQDQASPGLCLGRVCVK